MVTLCSKNKFCLYLFYSLLIFTYFFPFFPKYTRYLGEFICFTFSILLIFWYSFYDFKLNKIALIASLTFIFLLIISVILDIDRVILRDLFEFIRPLYWVFSFTIFYTTCSFANSKKVTNFTINIIFVLAIWGILESLFSVPYLLHIGYKLDENVYFNKAIASLIAPYSYGSIIGVGLIFSYMKYKYTSKFFYLGIYLVFFIAIIFSQSKSCILASLIISVSLFIFEYTFVTLIFMPFLCFLSYYLYFHTSYLVYLKSFLDNTYDAFLSGGFTTLLHSSDSISNRLDQINVALLNLNIVPLFGSGIGKNYLYIESFFLIIYRYGIFGIVLSAIIVIYIFIICKKIQAITTDISLFCLSKSFIYCILFLMISSLSANLIDQFRVSLIYFGIIGVILSSHNKYKKLV